ncbi:adenosine receptor A3-like [Montipora capricornis]|uniref:adenosine receptor A3-like n=1 Tax=Montipora capricornis TaxID=246305 RepID=UPI0035F1CE85
MALANFSKVGRQKTMTELLCSQDLTEGIHHELRWIAAINILLSFTAFVGNATFLVSLKKVSSLHPPSKLLFRTLATTDLCVGIIAQPLTAVALMPEVKQHIQVCRCVSAIRFLAAYPLCMVSMLTSTAITVDRLFALSLGLRYRQVVTLKRTYLAVTFFWVLSIVFTGTSFVSTRVTPWYWFIVVSSSLAISAFSYAKIFLLLRHNQNRVNSRVFWQRQQNQAFGSPNAEVYTKTVFTILWVQMALFVCYVPYSIVGLIIRKKTSVSIVFIWRCAGTLLFCNSSLNPALYFWKMRAVKIAVKETIRNTCFFRGCS